MPAAGTGPFISDRERALYAQLWALADAEGEGRLGGLKAVSFLSASGCSKPVLKQIWDIVDVRQQGALGPNEFAAALRLAAHAQAGRQIVPELAFQEPQSLPVFDFGAGAPPGSSASGRGRSPVRSDRLMPAPRDLRKYGRLFVGQLQGRGPNLPADLSRGLFLKSGLPEDLIARIWGVADADMDGMLSWPEFVVAMHLIRRARAGQPVSQAIPVDLRNLVAGLGPAEAYASQASRSPRRSDLSTASATSLFDAASVASRSGSRTLDTADLPRPAVSGSPFATVLTVPEPSPEGSPVASSASAWPSGLPGVAAADFPAADFEEADGKKSKSGRKKGGKNEGKSVFDTQGTLLSTERSLSPTSRGGFSPDFGARQAAARADGGLLGSLGAADGAPPVEHLEALIEAEKRLVQVLRADTDQLDQELTRLEEACRREEKEAARECSETDRTGQERLHLEQQLEASRRQLRELKAEHEGMHLESILLRQDRGHYGNEVTFLQRLFDGGSQDAQALQQSIEYLEQSNQSLVAHTTSLEEARREIQQQVRLEKEFLLKEELEVQSAKQALETLRGASAEGAAALSRLSIPPSAVSGDALGFGPSAFDDVSRPWTPEAFAPAPRGGSAPGSGGSGRGFAGAVAAPAPAAGGAAQLRPARAPAIISREGV